MHQHVLDAHKAMGRLGAIKTVAGAVDGVLAVAVQVQVQVESIVEATKHPTATAVHREMEGHGATAAVCGHLDQEDACLGSEKVTVDQTVPRKSL